MPQGSNRSSVTRHRADGRILKVINAPITIWALSVIFLSFGGLWLSTYQQCKRDFNEFRDEFSAVTLELYSRRLNLGFKLGAAKSLVDVRNAIRPEGTYGSYLTKSNTELENRLRYLSLRISQPSDRASPRSSLHKSEHYLKWSSLLLGRYPESLTESDLPELRLFGGEILDDANTQTSASVLLVLFPRCSPPQLFDFAFSDSLFRADGIPFDDVMRRLKNFKPVR